jgi:hypothetical protein
MHDQTPAPGIPTALFAFSLLYGGLVVLAGRSGHQDRRAGALATGRRSRAESGIFAFLLLVVMASAVAELYGQDVANRLVRFGFVPLICSMLLLTFVINVVPPAPFWGDQEAYARLLGQGADAVCGPHF